MGFCKKNSFVLFHWKTSNIFGKMKSTHIKCTKTYLHMFVRKKITKYFSSTEQTQPDQSINLIKRNWINIAEWDEIIIKLEGVRIWWSESDFYSTLRKLKNSHFTDGWWVRRDMGCVWRLGSLEIFFLNL